MTVVVELLGPVVVRVDGVPADLGVRARALLARLALDPGRVVSVDALVDALWDGAPPAAPANALQAVVSRVRRAVPGLPLVARAPGYLLDLPRDAVDACRLEDLATTDPAAAEALWRGEPLADLRDLAFTAAPAARWAELRLVAAERRLAGAGAAQLPELDRLVAEHPLREGLVALRVLALHRAGRTTDALAAHEQTRRRLAEELGLDPGPALRAAQLAVLREEEPERPVLRTALTSFRGRVAELDLVADRLAGGRLVTLLGPGGAGKTRLALEVAHQREASTSDGVWWVELAPVGEPRQLPAAVLTAVGQRTATTLERVPTVVEAGARLREVFASRRGLLVLDNCEHLVDAVARLTDDLLTACPGLVVLTTSREALGIPGEALVPVGPLPVPEADDPGAADADVVRLFADRARSADPSFAVTPATLPLLLEVCRRLDGMPLALELAAARLRTLGLAQIAARLDDRFALLTGGSRVALPRQQTLRAVVEWSWESLGAAEQEVGRRLSVPADGATLEAAEALCGPGVLDAVAGLVEKSLLTAVPEGDGVRYRMLETVRAYGAEQLDAAGERAATEAAHTAWCRALLDRVDPLLRGPHQLDALRELRAEHDNLVAALQREVAAGRGEAAVHLAGRMAWFWLLSGQQTAAARQLAEVARLPVTPSPMRTVCLTFAALAAADEQGWGGVRDVLAEVVALPDELGAAADEPVAVVSWALAVVFLGEPDRLAVSATHPDPWVRAVVHAATGLAAENDGRFDSLAEDLAAARAAFLELGDRWGISITSAGLGQLAAQDGDLPRAAELVAQALRCSDELGTSDDSPMLRVRVALLRAAAGDVADAAAQLDDVLVHLTRLGGPVLAFAESARAQVALLAGDRELAELTSGAAVVRLGRGGSGPDQMSALVRTVRAQVLAGRDAVDAAVLAEAEELLDQAQRETMHERGDMPVLAVVLVGRAVLAEAAGDPAGSARMLGLAEAVRGRADRGDPLATGLRARLVAALGPAAVDEAVAAGVAVGRVAALAEVGAEVVSPSGS
ncbi:Transcriptional activator with OmpR/PhoB-type DNA-binding domain and NB-ARC domain [Klenkia terrae]|uniref:ATP-binding protein n=1 Tax=Klenkia terrae TaxID=1052259 RepID=UPI00176161A2|nr:BTAD domain-containing putative transcriptional regulator [Klenkia terrae]SSC25342.1 Transcriptional activator with OmpR/PhoB-type DNA-binding domain and NB-ARC domain [Klenkia terrae]